MCVPSSNNVFYLKEAVRRAVTDDRAIKLIARALSIQDRKCVQNALLIIKEGCLYPEFQLQKYVMFTVITDSSLDTCTMGFLIFVIEHKRSYNHTYYCVTYIIM